MFKVNNETTKVNILHMLKVNYNDTGTTPTDTALLLLSILINNAPNLQLLNILLERILLEDALKLW